MIRLFINGIIQNPIVAHTEDSFQIYIEKHTHAVQGTILLTYLQSFFEHGQECKAVLVVVRTCSCRDKDYLCIGDTRRRPLLHYG